MEGVGVNPEFWAGRRIFLTGHTGFKGSWLSLWLQQMRATVRGLALDPPSQPALFEIASVAKGMDDRRGDIRDPAVVREAIREFAPEIVIHMAAQALVRPSYADPVGTYATNVMGTVHVLDAVRACASIRAVLVVTSDKCYENREWDRAYVESDAMGGFDPYSSSKGCAELVTSAYRRSYFQPERLAQHRVAVATARAGNVIGGGDWSRDRLVPDAMRAFLAGREFQVRFPDAVRPWQHVLEPLGGYLELLERLCQNEVRFADAWNFGPDADSERPVSYLAARMAALWGEGASWRNAVQAEAPHEARHLTLNTAKVKQMLGWNPRLRLDEALELTVQWYKAYQKGENMRALCLDQISDFAVNRHETLRERDGLGAQAVADTVRGLCR